MSQIHVIIGTDDLLVAEEANKTVGDGVGLEVIDSYNSTNEELQLHDIAMVRESFQTAPFFDPSKVTWWKNVRFLPGGKAKGEGDEKGGLSEAVKNALQRLAEDIAHWNPDRNQSLIITAPRLLPTSIFAKMLKACADFKVFEPLKGNAAVQDAILRAETRAKAMGLTFASGVSAKFIARVGTDERSIRNELEKLRDYLDPKTVISELALEEITSQGIGIDMPTWEVTDAITARNPERAATVLRKFEGDSSFAVMMTTIIEKQFRTLVELKAAEEAGRFEEAVGIVGLPPWKARSIAQDLRRWSLIELRTARLRFMNLRERCVSSASSADASVVIELLRALEQRK